MKSRQRLLDLSLNLSRKCKSHRWLMDSMVAGTMWCRDAPVAATSVLAWRCECGIGRVRVEPDRKPELGLARMLCWRAEVPEAADARRGD